MSDAKNNADGVNKAKYKKKEGLTNVKKKYIYKTREINTKKGEE